jgi:hypothetical protein
LKAAVLIVLLEQLLRLIAPEDLLCSTFAIMTRTKGTEVLFKEGLDKLKETSPEVSNPDDSVISIYA